MKTVYRLVTTAVLLAIPSQALSQEICGVKLASSCFP